MILLVEWLAKTAWENSSFVSISYSLCVDYGWSVSRLQLCLLFRLIVDDGMWRPTIEKKTQVSFHTLASTNCSCCIIRRDDSWSVARSQLSPYSRAIDEDRMWIPTIEKKTRLSSPTLASTNCLCCKVWVDYDWSIHRSRLCLFYRVIVKEGVWRPTIGKGTLVSSSTPASTNCSCCHLRGMSFL